ncbi:MAG TPA: phosphatidylglycerol lysyltransferase domain-containing protein [Pseudonocardiaceae bacterium]|jgi:lysyl-tRNA synthetase class 2|nr:phosphatidylglycerol lysyltransferase domain-containing protein [Pseudonocardiaceae bacterium]
MRRVWVWPFGLVAVAVGMYAGIVAVRGAVPGWAARPSHGFTQDSPGPHGLLLALLLIVLGWGLLRARRVALVATVLAIGWATLALRHTTWSILPIGYALALVLCYHGFPAVPERGQVRAAARNGALAAVVTLLIEGAARHGWVAHLGLAASSLIVIVVVLITILRAAPAPAPASEAERARVAALVRRPGADTLAPFALRSDKSYVFSEDGTAAVGYRVLLGVAVVGGDPIGDPRGYADVIARFIALCRHNGWRPAVLGARAELAGLWDAQHLTGLQVGEEVMIDVPTFSLATRRMRNVRQAVGRTHNAGITTRVARAGELEPALLTEMSEVSADWLGKARERGFSMVLDGLFDIRNPDAVFVLAFDPAGHVVGFQRYLPAGFGDGPVPAPGAALSLDVMRRERGRFNGLNERMIVDLVGYAEHEGIGTVSLNFAAFRALLDRGADRRPVQRLGYRTLHLLDPFIQVESLYLFNAKFRPGYLGRRVAFGSWFALPVVLLALLGLEFALPYDLRRHGHGPGIWGQ